VTSITYDGKWNRPTSIVRQLDDGTPIVYQYQYDAFTGGAALGGAVGMVAKGIKGFEFSHFAPARWIKNYGIPRGLINNSLNGTYVPWLYHAMTDAFRYRFIARTLKAIVPSLPNGIAQALRTPPWLVGGALGSRVNSNCGCYY
jgi:hypothetical protein